MSVAAAPAVDLGGLRARLERAIADNDDAKAEVWGEYRREMLIRRYIALSQCDTPEGREVLAALCAKSPFFFMRVLGVVVETRDEDDTVGTVIPFIPFPHQEEAAAHMLRSVDLAQTVMFPKTRDMGLTWVALHLIAWFWLFRPGFQALLGSRVEDAVDKVVGARNAQTLFGRLEIILDAVQTQAPWLMPRHFSLKKKEHRQQLYLLNPENGAQIEGQASSPHFSRQGRYRVILLDEFDFWPHSDAVFGSTQDSTRGRWIITTANKIGRGTAKRIIDQGKATIVEYAWDKHPLKTMAWYREQAEKRFDDDLGSEVDISWEGNKELRIYQEWDRVPQGVFPYKPGLPTYGAIDFGRGDGTGIIIAQRDPHSGRWRLLGSIYVVGQTIDYFFPLMGSQVTSGIHSYSDEAMQFIEKMKVWGRGGIIWYGDPSGQHLQQTATLSIIQQLQQARIFVQTNPSIKHHEQRQAVTKVLLRNCEVDAAGCRMLDASMKNYRKPKPRDGVRPQKLAVHNWASHLATALEYLAVNALPDRPEDRAPATLPRQRAAWEAA
jgi:hypothetical protein